MFVSVHESMNINLSVFLYVVYAFALTVKSTLMNFCIKIKADTGKVLSQINHAQGFMIVFLSALKTRKQLNKTRTKLLLFELIG